MAIFYKNQGIIEKLSVKNSVSSYRLSEQRQILYGGRGQKYDELTYLRGQNGSGTAVDAKDSDAWQKFGSANGANTTRSDQTFHDFTKNGSFP